MPTSWVDNLRDDVLGECPDCGKLVQRGEWFGKLHVCLSIEERAENERAKTRVRRVKRAIARVSR